MSNDTRTPAFPEGSTVRDRQTGLEYTATGETIPGNGQPVYWAMVTGADGVERQLPACDLEPVQVGRISNAGKSKGRISNAIVQTADSDDVLRAAVSGAQYWPGLPIQAAPLPVLVSVLVRVKSAL